MVKHPIGTFDEKLRNRMLRQILSVTGAVLVLLGLCLYFAAHRLLEQQVTAKTEAVVDKAAGEVEMWLDGVADISRSVAAVLAESDMSEDKLLEWLKLIGERHKTFAAFVGFEEDGRFVDPDWTPPEDYDPRLRPWYVKAKQHGEQVFSDPYKDGLTGELIITVAAPFRRGERIAGVAGMDLSLAKILGEVRKLGGEHSEGATVIDRQGTYVVHPRSDYVLKENISNSPEAETYQAFRAAGRATGIFESGTDYVVFATIPSAKWVVAYRLDRSAVNGPVLRLAGAFAGGAAAALGVLALCIVLISRVLARPITVLADSAERVTEGDFSCQVAVDRRDELGLLSHCFNRMVSGLQERERIRRDLTESRANQARLEGELQAAHDIQMAMLPQHFEPDPRFDFHAVYSPAKEVGGDFYDRFELPDGRIAIVVGDVSGKGVPAALFMTFTCISLRIICQREATPDTALAKANRILATNNDACMFVTVFLLYYDPRTGECVFANAGHNPPLITQGGVFTWLLGTHGPAMGPFDDIDFASDTVHLHRGDLVLLYTDGVTEAHSDVDELFGEDRFREALRNTVECTATNICDQVIHSVTEFQGPVQFDDITLLVCRHIGGEKA